MIRRPSILVSLFVTAVILGGCRTNDTDPTKGGFFGGVGGLVTGNYEAGVKQREQNLENAQDEQIALQREADRLDEENQYLETEIERSERQLDALDDSLRSLEDRIEQARIEERANQDQLAELERELEGIDSEVDRQRLSLDERKKQAKIEELQRRKQKLEEALLALLQ